MSDRRPLAIAIVVLTIAVLVGAVYLFDWNGLGSLGGANAKTKASHMLGASSNMERGSIEAKKGNLPQDIQLVPATENGMVTGQVICSNCTFKTGQACNVMIYDETARHLVSVLPNEHYEGLNALIGST